MKRIILILLLFFAVNCYCQNGNVVLNFPNSTVLYEKFSSVLKVGFTNKKIKKYYLKCEGCDTIFQQSNNSNEYVVTPGNTNSITLTVLNKRTGEIIEKSQINVVALPKPTLKIDNLDNQNTIKIIPENLHLENLPLIPVVSGYVILNWTIQIQDKTFVGTTAKLSNEVKDNINRIQKGVMIIDVEYVGVYGRQKMKEIFEFDI